MECYTFIDYKILLLKRRCIGLKTYLCTNKSMYDQQIQGEKTEKIWWKFCLANFFLIVLAYAVYFLNIHYSEDSFEAFLNIGALANTNLRNGRIIHYLLYTFLAKISFNILTYQSFTQLLLTLVLAFGVTKILKAFLTLIHNATLWQAIIIDLGLLFIFFSPNFMFGWYYWPETYIGASLSMLVTFLAVDAWCKEKLNWKHIALSFILVCLSVGMYQVYVELYVGLCLTFTLMKYNFKCKKDAVKEYIIIIFCGGISSVINIIFMMLLQRMNIIYRDARSATLSLEVIIENTRSIINDQGKIWTSLMGFLPKHFLQITVIGILIILIGGIIVNKVHFKLKDYIFVFINLATVYVLAFVPNIISNTLWLAPRTYIGLYAFFFMLIIYAVFTVRDNLILKKLYFYFTVFFVFISVVCLLRLQTQTIVSNRFDEYEINTIGRKMREYTAETDKEIKKVYYIYDDERTFAYNEVKYVAFDNNTRGMAYDWCFENMIKYFVDSNVTLEKMSEDKYKEYFDNKSWNYFEPEQQLYFQDEELYLVIY